MITYPGIDAAKGHLASPAVALGNFDGVHLGHQALLAEAVRRARPRSGAAVAFTFDPHPGKILSPEFAPPLLCTLERRLQLFEAAGLDAVVVQPFDRGYAALSAEEFLERDLIGALRARDLVVGSDFTYGRARQGTVESLRLQCADRGVGLAVIRPVDVDGLVVSSTKIREFLLEGRVTAAARLLGRPFDISGEVVHGVGRGRSIGFSTANVAPRTELVPGIGVYAVRAHLTGSRVLGGAANIGRKPTFGDNQVTVEVHLFDFEGDLYGQTIAVEFLERLRGEQHFASTEALARQIGEDVARARRIVGAAPPPGPWGPRL